MRVNKAVGKFLLHYRTRYGLTLEDIAAASQRYGSGWSAATVVSIQRGGSRADSLPVLILLIQSLNDLTGNDLTVSDLFVMLLNARNTRTRLIDITDSLSIRNVDMCDILRGKHVNLRNLNISSPGSSNQDQEGPKADDAQTAGSEDTSRYRLPTFAEKRASAKIGVPPEVFSGYCTRLYGRSLDEEAAARAGEGASPQKRGRATRVIVSEVSAAINAVCGVDEDENQT